MRTRVTFTVPGKPQGKARPRFTRVGQYVRTYTPKGTHAYEQQIRDCFREQCQEWELTDRPVGIIVMAYFPVPKSASKVKRDEMLGSLILPTVKPDGDNILKAVLDGLAGTAICDDKQVVDMTVQKRYAAEPCLKITMYME